jgi:hypothetical protein
MKYFTFTVSATVPVPDASLLGGNKANKGLSKIDRENRYFLNAILNRGGVLISQVETDAKGVAVAAKAAVKS